VSRPWHLYFPLMRCHGLHDWLPCQGRRSCARLCLGAQAGWTWREGWDGWDDYLQLSRPFRNWRCHPCRRILHFANWCHARYVFHTMSGRICGGVGGLWSALLAWTFFSRSMLAFFPYRLIWHGHWKISTQLLRNLGINTMSTPPKKIMQTPSISMCQRAPRTADIKGIIRVHRLLVRPRRNPQEQRWDKGANVCRYAKVESGDSHGWQP